jgi:hypothetical protein
VIEVDGGQEVLMALTGDCSVGKYEGHTIELIRNNWNKTLKLVIDGEEVASESCLFPGRFTLTGTLAHNRKRHAVVAKSIPYRLVLTKDTIAVDGNELPITSETPRGLFQATLKAAGEGHLSSVILVGAIVVGLAILTVVGVSLLIAWLR